MLAADSTSEKPSRRRSRVFSSTYCISSPRPFGSGAARSHARTWGRRTGPPARRRNSAHPPPFVGAERTMRPPSGEETSMAPRDPAPHPPPGGSFGWPLIGRDEELEFLRSARRRHPPAGVVVSGLPGVGKSRLVSAALDAAREEGWGVLRVSASAGLKRGGVRPFPQGRRAAADEGPRRARRRRFEDALARCVAGDKGLMLARGRRARPRRGLRRLRPSSRRRRIGRRAS